MKILLPLIFRGRRLCVYTELSEYVVMANIATNGLKKKPLNLRRKPRLGEMLIQGLLFFSGIFSIFTTVGIVYELGKEALLFFQMPEVNLLQTLTSIEWKPHVGKFGMWPLVTSTLLTTVIAMSIAIPLGLSVSIYLSEYASPKMRSVLKPI